jgi:3-hydroxyisobutyrate dehydrogenase-like beta-hydroxyacid dehydrogenase
MGAPMATNLVKAGFPLTVWNRTASKVESLQRVGAQAGKGPAQVAAECDITITMVSQPADVEQIVLGPDGVADGIKAGAVLMDLSTVSPATSRKLAGAVATKHAEFVDAPVVGSKGPATAGTLVILVGGLPTTLERVRPVLSKMGKAIVHAGGVGAGSALKLATNLMLAHLAAGFAEGLLLLQRAGLDPKRYLEVLDASTFRSPWYQSKGQGMIQRDFTPHFALKHMHKDLTLMNELIRETGTAAPITHAIEQLFAASKRAGLSEQDYSAVLGFLTSASTDAA